MKGFTLSRTGEGAVLSLLAFSILWKGGKTLEMTWLLALLAGFLSVASLAKRVFRARKTEDEAGDPHLAVWFMILAYACWTVLSYVLSETRNYGLDEVLRDVAVVILFLWAVRATVAERSPSFLKNFLNVVTWTTLLACLVGVAVYALEPVDRLVGTFFDYRFNTDFWPNAWGEYLLLAWPLVVLRAVIGPGKARCRMHSALLGLILGCLFLSYSRGSILALAGQIALVAALLTLLAFRDVRYRNKILTDVRFILIQACIVAAVALATFFASNAMRSVHFPVQSVSEKATFTASEGRSSIDERAQFWRQAWEASMERPWFGYGPYSFRFVQTEKAQGVLATSDHAHNVFLKLAMERGWPAAFFFSLIIAFTSLYILHKLFFVRRAEWSRENDARDVLLVTAALGVVAHNLIDYNLQFVAIKLPLWLIFAMLYAPAVAGRTNRTASFWRWKISRIAMKVEFLLALALLTVTCVEGYYLVTSSFGRHADAAGDKRAALEWYAKSDGELFSRDLLLSKAVILMDEGRTQEAGEALHAYAKLNPHDARVWKLLGILSLKRRDPALAYGHIRRAHELGRMTDLGITTLYLQSALAAGKTEDLRARKTDIDTLFSQYATAIGRNTHFIALSRNVEELQTVARLLSQLYPSESKRYLEIARQAADHAAEERSRLSSRTPGILW